MAALLDRVARRAGRASTALSFLARTLSVVDTNPVPGTWQHVTKVDPEDRKQLPVLYPLYLQHTDAVSVGGSADVTVHNTEETFELLDLVPDLPVFQEPSGASHVSYDTLSKSAFLAIPEVLNGDSESLVGTLGEGIEHIRETMIPRLVHETVPGPIARRCESALADFGTWWLLSTAVFEAYVIQNPESAAAREANVTAADLLDPAEATQRALAAERRLESELIYLEYSGTFGGDEAVAILESIDDATTWSRLWYGGGLDARENVERILDAGADTVVVGDAFHDVAADELALAERAADALDPDATLDDVRAWLDDSVAISDTAAARYLSTTPAVQQPAATASEYLALSVHALLGVQHAVDAAEPPTDEGSATEGIDSVEHQCGDLALGNYLSAALGQHGVELAAAYLQLRRADAAGTDPELDLPVSQLAH